VGLDRGSACEGEGAEVSEPRLFHLQRDVDVTGASGTGRVADGVRWPDGTANVHWRGPRSSNVFWRSLADLVEVHGHGGATRVVWDDDGSEVS